VDGGSKGGGFECELPSQEFCCILKRLKKLDPIPQFKAKAKLGEFLNQLPA